MFSKVRKRLTITNIALALALVFAMTGGAYAAKKYVITSTKQISPAVLKQLQGRAGPAGSPGAQGPAGPAGTNGTNGTNGKDGQNGANGNNGAAGATGPTGPKGATGATGATGENGLDGSEGKKGATGPTGPTGPEGVCAKAGCTLPSGVSEEGTWGAAGLPGPFIGALEAQVSTISFTVPLPSAVKANIIKEKEGEGEEKENLPEGCKGTYSHPKAEKGHLCIFVYREKNVGGYFVKDLENEGAEEAGKGGTVIIMLPATAKSAEFILGTWAATAE